MGGENPSKSDIIDYVSIPTLGNAVDFGNLTSARDTEEWFINSCCICRRRYSKVNTIDYVQIMTIGDAIDFGDLNFVSVSGMSCSNGHGGLDKYYGYYGRSN